MTRIHQSDVSVRNRVKPATITTALVVHLLLASATFGISLVLLAITGTATLSIYRREAAALRSGQSRFKRTFAFRGFGEVFGEFQHVFAHEQTLDRDLHMAIERSVTTRTPIDALEIVRITDVDRDLTGPDARDFVKAQAEDTSRGTTVTLLLDQSSYGRMRSVRWRVLVGGFLDRDRVFARIAYSPLLLPFWLVPYLRKDYDFLSGLRNIHPGSYNSLDVTTLVRALHDAVFEGMIEELDAKGIDTSELKAQKMQVMNINVSGGRVSMGNVVQGAMNRVTSAASGARAAA